MTDTQSLTLAEFLLARIAEDEDSARIAHDELVEHASGWDEAGNPSSDWRRSWKGFGRSAWTETAGNPISTHIARRDPARILAECEAKRRIVERHRRITRPGWGLILPDQCGECGGNSGIVGWPCPTLRLLTLPYTGHPDYRDEWRL